MDILAEIVLFAVLLFLGLQFQIFYSRKIKWRVDVHNSINVDLKISITVLCIPIFFAKPTEKSNTVHFL